MLIGAAPNAETGSTTRFKLGYATFRILFAFVILRHDRRKLVHFNVTAHPTAEWAAQQIVEAFPDDTVPRFLIRDRDRIYGGQFQIRVSNMGIQTSCHGSAIALAESVR